MLEIIEDKKSDVLIIALKGKLDALTSEMLGKKMEALVETKEQRVIMDFSHLDFISSSGLRVLLTTAKRMNALEGKLALCNLQDRVGEVFDLAGFSMLFSIFPSREEALIRMQ